MQRDERLLSVGVALLGAFLIGEVVAAVVIGSLALLADAGHMLTDALALVAAIVASRLARRPASGHLTFGLARAEILSAAVNGITLLVVAGIITVEAVTRLIHPHGVPGAGLVVVAAIGLVVNAAVTAVVSQVDRHSLNIAGVVAHVLTDAYAFAATVIAGVVILATGWTRADPVASLVVVVLLLRAAAALLRDSGRVLLEAAPSELDLDRVRSHLLESDQVLAIHDLHVWTVTSGLPALSVHVVVTDECFATGRAPRLLDELQVCLGDHFDVGHSTFQLEAPGHDRHEAAVTHG